MMSLFKQPLLMTCLYTDVQYYKVVSPQFFNTGQAAYSTYESFFQVEDAEYLQILLVSLGSLGLEK